MNVPPKLQAVKFKRNKIYFMYGPMQSGKSLAIQFLLWQAKQAGTNVTVLVRNITADQEQLVYRIERHNHTFKASHLGRTEVLTSKTTDANISDLLEKHPTESHNLVPNQHLLMLGNAPNAERLYKVLTAAYPPVQCHGVLIVDEADLIGLDFDKSVTKINNVETFLQALRPFFHTIIMLSATPFASVFTTGTNRITDMIVLDVPSDYYGVEKFSHVATSTYYHPSSATKHTSYDPDSDQVNLDLVFTDLLNQDQGRLLITTSRRTSDHDATIKYIHAHYPSVTCIEFNNSRAKVVGSGNKPIPFGKVSHIKNIGDALQYVKDEHAVSGDHNHVAIVGGQMASRGISFVNREVQQPGQWHLTHQYLVASRNATMDMLMQMMRLCGRYPGSPTLKLFCESDLWEQIKGMNADFKYVTQKMEVLGANQEMFELLATLKRKWVAKRKLDALAFVPELVKHTDYATETAFQEQAVDVELVTKKLFLKTGPKALLKELQEMIRESGKRNPNTQKVQYRETAEYTQPMRDAIVKALNGKMGFVDNFAIESGIKYRAKLPTTTTNFALYPDFEVHKGAGLIMVFDDPTNPYIVVKDRRFRDKRVNRVMTGDYAWHNEQGGITVTHEKSKPIAIKK